METIQSPHPTPEPTPQAGPKNNRNMIIWIVVAVVLCCCCVVTAVAGYYGYQAYLKAQQVAQEVQNIQIPDIPTDVPFVNPDGTAVAPNLDLSGQAPQGGLADEQTRYVTWASVQIIAVISGCSSPTVDGTTITVLQQPDASGNWQEEWNVNCGDGTNKAYKVDFTNENGVVTPNVEMPQQ